MEKYGPVRSTLEERRELSAPLEWEPAIFTLPHNKPVNSATNNTVLASILPNMAYKAGQQQSYGSPKSTTVAFNPPTLTLGIVVAVSAESNEPEEPKSNKYK